VVTARLIGQLLVDVDLEDPHAFASAYVDYVERTGSRPAVAAAMMSWLADGSLDGLDLG
jgi:hypothetical protein